MIERYTLPEMGRIWSDAHKYELWCRVELLVLEAHARAGTATDSGGDLVSAGGRVLNVVGSGADVAAARAAAYELAGTVSFRGGWYRRDIAEGV